MEKICDSGALEGLLNSLAKQIAGRRKADAPLALVGVRTRGLPIAERLGAILKAQGIETPRIGAVDTTLYRDDLGQAERWPLLQGTEIDFAVEGAEIVLVDDVLHTGRSVRAALNTICDLGRPACVRLAVVVDRGGRELPIQADYVGTRCEAKPGERIVVRVKPVDEDEGIVRVDDGARE